MPFVYAVVHNAKGDFIICTKNIKGYFFHNPRGDDGTIIPEGERLNGGGLFAFPGGKPDSGGIIEGARAELLEETGIEVGTGGVRPPYYEGDRGAYYGVYFDAGSSLIKAYREILDHLTNGSNAARAVIQGRYTRNDQYRELLEAYKICPEDNELAGATVWNVFQNRADIERLRDNRATDWFYHIIRNLEKALYRFEIRSTEDQSVLGLAKGISRISESKVEVEGLMSDGQLRDEERYTVSDGKTTYSNVFLVESSRLTTETGFQEEANNSASQKTSQTKGKLSFALAIPGNNVLGDPIPVTFSITNNAAHEVAVLQRYTPLEGIRKNIFNINNADGQRLGYDGRLVKRGNPHKSEYLLLQPGETKSQTVDITDTYFFDSPGDFTIELDTLIRDYIVLDSEEKHALIGANEHPEAIPVRSEKISFSITDSGQAHKLTLGMIHRNKESHTGELLGDTKLELQAPVFQGGTKAQRTEVKKAHEKAYVYANKSVEALKAGEKTPNYKKWFGTYTKILFATVRTVYNSVQTMFNNSTITYNLECGDGCEMGDFAYTYYKSKTVWLCELFWKAPVSGFNSKFGTIIHELTHATANTEDETYGIVEAQELAKNNAALAANNADNFEYFSENIS